MSITLPIQAGASLESGDATFTILLNASAVNISGCTLKFRRRWSLAASTDPTEIRPMTIVSAASGTCTLSYTSAETQALQAGTHLCEIEVTFGSGRVVRISDINMVVNNGID